MKALEVRYVPREDLRPYGKNARTHSEAQVQQIAASIQAFGWTNPILVDEVGGVIAGHGRLAAASRLGLVEVPTICLPGLTATQRRALVIADNRLAENAGWDESLLAAELGALRLEDFDLALTGFSEQEIDALVARQAAHGGLTDPDAAPEPPAEPVSRVGDLWACGRHRVLCGDATNGMDVARLMDGRKAGLCFTSPPYAQQRDYTKAITDWDGLMRGVFGALPMDDSGQVLVNLGLVHRDGEWWPYWNSWVDWMREQGWRRFGWYVWDQGFGLPGDWNGRLAPSHEFIFHFNRESTEPSKWVEKKAENIKPRGAGESTMRGKDGKTKAFTNPGASAQPTKVPDSIVRVGRQVGSDGHPAQFPVGLPEFVMRSWPEGVAYEPFAGSGTSIIAAEQLGRDCCAMELAPEYVDVIVRRWQDFTGQQATLNGVPFSEVVNERKKTQADAPEAGDRESGEASAKRKRGEARARDPAPAAAS